MVESKVMEIKANPITINFMGVWRGSVAWVN